MCALDTVVTAATVGRAMAASAAISPGRFVPSSSAAARCSAVSLSRVSGSPHWLLKLDSGLSTGPRAPSTAAISSLVVVLPFEPVTDATGMLKRAAMPGAEAAERHRRIVHEDEGNARRQLVGHGVHDEAARAAAHRVTEKGVTVEPVSANREEHLAHVERAAVDRHAGHGDAEIAADEGASGAADDLLDSECRHARSYVALPASAARAWARSSKGSTSEPMI